MPSVDLNTANVATVLVIIFAIVGGVGSIIDPQALPFDDYIKFVLGAVAVLGIGRGLAAKSR